MWIMNKDLLNQIPAEEQPMASHLAALAEDMPLSPAFAWELENRLMEKHQTQDEHVRPTWYTRIVPALGWAIAALGAVFLLSLIMPSLIPALQPGTEETATPVLSFEDRVRQGSICAGPLAVGHNFSVALTNADKTSFVRLDEQQTISELRSFAWSPDGEKLAVLGNTAGNGNIYLTDSNGETLQPVLLDSELGYLMDVSWSRDGKGLVLWSLQNNQMAYVLNADGTGLQEIPLGLQIFATPQFTPGMDGLVFYGADSSAAGLFEFKLDGSQTRLISSLVENESAFAWSPDGRSLAYMIADRTLGEALLVVEEYVSGEKTVLASLPLPKGSGSSLPDVANLNWSADGGFIVFEFGRSASDRTIYLAHTDGTGLVKLVESAHAPAISADGRCLAYISDQQVFVLDLTETVEPSTATPVFLVELPVGRGVAAFPLDKLQWRP
jgi:hypothetical protein